MVFYALAALAAIAMVRSLTKQQTDAFAASGDATAWAAAGGTAAAADGRRGGDHLRRVLAGLGGPVPASATTRRLRRPALRRPPSPPPPPPPQAPPPPPPADTGRRLRPRRSSPGSAPGDAAELDRGHERGVGGDDAHRDAVAAGLLAGEAPAVAEVAVVGRRRLPRARRPAGRLSSSPWPAGPWSSCTCTSSGPRSPSARPPRRRARCRGRPAGRRRSTWSTCTPGQAASTSAFQPASSRAAA